MMIMGKNEKAERTLESAIKKIERLAKIYGISTSYEPFINISLDESYALLEYIKDLEKKYDKALETLAKNDVPCEKDEFMEKNYDFCSKNCGADEAIYKACWDKYIEEELNKND